MKFTVKNWGLFQHYKDRNPPWIKLHFSLLSSSDWVMLDDASRVLAVASMLVASRNGGVIDGSEAGLAYLKRVAYLNKTPNLKPLISCGFLEPASGCKQMLADARPETEEETYKEETENTFADGQKNPDRPLKQNGHRIEFDQVKGCFVGITEDQELAWQDAYPAVPVPPAIARAAAWVAANPANRKSNWARFLVNWFSREQDKAGRVRK